jgi:hypothetical protein
MAHDLHADDGDAAVAGGGHDAIDEAAEGAFDGIDRQ